MRVDELNKDDMLRLKQLYMMAVFDTPPTYGELAAANEIVHDDEIKRVYGFVDIPEGFYIPEREARFKHSIKVILPTSPQSYEAGIGEGIWAIVDDRAKTAHDLDATAAGFDCVLDNASCYWIGLYPGEVMPLEMRGHTRPVVPFDWLNERFKLNRDFLEE